MQTSADRVHDHGQLDTRVTSISWRGDGAGRQRGQKTTAVPRLRSTVVSATAATAAPAATTTTACHCGETGGELRPIAIDKTTTTTD